MQRFVFACFASLLSLVAQNVWADSMLYYYSCDFEDPREMQNWVLNSGNKGATSVNKWYCGAAGSFGINSQNGLYISTSADTTVQAYAAPGNGYIVSYCTMSLAAGTYNLMFDYIGGGKESDAIYVFYVPATTNTNSNYGSTVTLPSWIPSSAVVARGGEWWQSCTGNIVADGNPGKLVVVFYYAKGAPVEPSFAIDNIQISSCVGPPPSNVRFNRKTQTLTWSDDNPGAYDIFVTNVNTNTSFSYEGVPGTSYTIPDTLTDGYYRFYVRRRYGSMCLCAWSSTKALLVPSRCIDYLDLTPDNSGVAKCYYVARNEWREGDYYDKYMYDHAGQVDYGYDNELSRHTIHYNKWETDPRTGGQLKTIPDDEIASVRVNGLWSQFGYYASMVEYEYVVEEDVNLRLRYAFVFASGAIHEENLQPRFKVEIYSVNSNSTIFVHDIRGGYGETNWHETQIGNKKAGWCDWSTINYYLQNRKGDTLKIRIAAYHCESAGHYGYAYFVLGCKQYESLNTDCWNYDLDHFEAPEGYLYRWYKADEDSVALSDSSVLQISRTDTTIYKVEITSPTDSTDRYTLTANPNPVGPIADVEAEVELSDTCYRVTFTNSSHVARVNRVTGVETEVVDMKLLSIVWDFGDGTPLREDKSTIVTHTYPKHGGEYTVRVYAMFVDSSCVDTLEIPLQLAQGEFMLTTISKHGTVTKSGMYEVNSRIPLEATPDEGFEFVMWSDGSMQNPHVLTITQDTTIWALYSKVNTSWELRADDWMDTQLQMRWAGVVQAERYDLNLFYNARQIVAKEIEADGSGLDVEVLADGLETEEIYIYSLDAWQGAETALDAKSGKLTTPAEQTGLIKVNEDETNGESQAYNVLGQPVDETYHGIVIKNGRKHLQ